MHEYASIKSERLTPEDSAHTTTRTLSPSRRGPMMPPGFPANLSFMLGLRSGPLGPLGHLSSTPSPANSAPTGPGNFTSTQLRQMETLSYRNYSDYMRSLAAKYNTNDSYTSSSPFGPPTPTVRPPLLRSPECPPSPASRTAPAPHQSPRAATEGHPSPRRSPLSSMSLADFSSSQALVNLARNHAQSSQLENYLKGAVKRSASSAQEGDPLDLSLSGPPLKRTRSPSLSPSSAKDHQIFNHESRSRSRSPRCSSVNCPNREHQDKLFSRWTVDDVVNFVQSIDVCAPYAEKFRDQSIDGSILSFLTEDHLTLYMGMRLGPALKLRQGLANMTGHCSVCLHCLHCRSSTKSPPLSTTRASSTSPSPRSSPVASPKNVEALGQPTPISSSPSPPPSQSSALTDSAA